MYARVARMHARTCADNYHFYRISDVYCETLPGIRLSLEHVLGFQMKCFKAFESFNMFRNETINNIHSFHGNARARISSKKESVISNLDGTELNDLIIQIS